MIEWSEDCSEHQRQCLLGAVLTKLGIVWGVVVLVMVHVCVDKFYDKETC